MSQSTVFCIVSASLKCGEDEFKCKGEGAICLGTEFVCDGVPQCPDKSDETNCPTSKMVCKPGYFTCDSGVSF